MKRGHAAWWVAFGFIAVFMIFATCARADVAGAQKALDDAKKNLVDKEWDNADTNIKLAETELDGVADADKKPIQDQLDAMKKQIVDAKTVGAKDTIKQRADSIVAEAKSYLTEHPDPEGVLNDSKQLDEFLNQDDTKAALSAAEIAAYRDQMAKYVKVASAKKSDDDIVNVGNEYQRLKDTYDTRMAAIKTGGAPGSHDDDINTLGRDLDIFSKHLAALPADNDKVKAMQASYNTMNAAFTAVAQSGQAATVLAALKDNWNLETEYKGWESENSPPTFEQFTKMSSQAMDAFNMPKTVNLRDRSEYFLDNRKNDNDYKAVASTPDVKALIDSIQKMHDDAYAKLLKASRGMVDQAEKAQITANNKNEIDRLKSDIRLALGDKSPDYTALGARLDKITNGVDAAAAGAEQAKLDAYKQLKADADKNWPDMLAKYHPVDGFDPNHYADFKGKQIKLNVRNRMGWDFNPGVFPFATTFNNIPIAAKYSPKVKAAIDDVEKKIGRGVGDGDEDGKWEVIAVVNGNQGQLSERKQSTGDVKTTDGEKVGTVSREDAVDVDAPIVTIIAAHCGPLAVSDSSDAATAEAVVGASGGPVSVWLHRLIFLLIGLVAAAAALVKAGFAPVVSVPQVGQMQTRIGGTNLAYIGFACALYGLVSMLSSYIIYGLLVNLAIIAAGLYVGLDWLVAQGLIKEDLAAKIRPLGVPIGLACGGLVILELIVGGRLYIL